MDVSYTHLTADESINDQFLTGSNNVKAYLKGKILEAFFKAGEYDTIEDHMNEIVQAVGALFVRAFDEFKLAASEVDRIHVQYVMKDGPMARLLEQYVESTVIAPVRGEITALGTYGVLSVAIGEKNNPAKRAKVRALERMCKMSRHEDDLTNDDGMDENCAKPDKHGLVRIKDGTIDSWRITITEFDREKIVA